MKKLLILFLLSALPLGFLNAQVVPEIPTEQEVPRVGLVDAVKKIVNVAFWIILVASILAFFWAAYTYITAGGDPLKAKMATEMFKWIVIGLIIAVMAYGIREFIKSKIGGA